LATIHQRYRQDRTDRQTDRQTHRQRSDSIGRTVLQTVAQKPRESDISLMCRDAGTGAIALNFRMRGDIADIIVSRYAKFYVNRSRGFGVSSIFPFSLGLTGRPYDSVWHFCATVWWCGECIESFRPGLQWKNFENRPATGEVGEQNTVALFSTCGVLFCILLFYCNN